MTLVIELPDDLEKELLQQTNINEFVQKAIKKLLLEQQQTRQSIVKLTKEKQENTETYKEHTTKTQELIGILKNTDNFVMEKDNTEELLELITQIKPVKCQYTTEQIVRSLRDGTELV